MNTNEMEQRIRRLKHDETINRNLIKSENTARVALSPLTLTLSLTNSHFMRHKI